MGFKDAEVCESVKAQKVMTITRILDNKSSK